jgi:hypothetical protein
MLHVKRCGDEILPTIYNMRMTNERIARCGALTTATRWVAAIATIAILCPAAQAAGMAIAGGSIEPADPGSIDGAIGMLATYGPVIGGMYLLFTIASSIVSRYQATSWLAQGKRLAWATGLLGISGAALQAAIAGSTPFVILAAAAAMTFKLLIPTIAVPASTANATSAAPAVTPALSTAPTTPAAPPPTPTIIKATLVILTILAVGTLPLQISCGPKSAAVARGIWDCLSPERQQAVDALTPLAESAILAAASADGKLIDASKLRAATSRATLETEAGVLIQCAMASAIAAFLKPSPAGTGASPLVLDPDAVRQAWSQVAPEGQRFKTKDGTI